MRSTPIHPFEARLVLAGTEAERAKLTKTYGIPPTHHQAETTLVHDTHNGAALVCIYLPSDHPQYAALAVHEATHATVMLMEHIGEPITSASETVAYLNAWIWNWITKARTGSGEAT